MNETIDDVDSVKKKNPQLVQNAVVELVENKIPIDQYGTTDMLEMYTTLKEIFQNESLGDKQISEIREKPIILVQREEPVPTTNTTKSMVTRKSTARSRALSIL